MRINKVRLYIINYWRTYIGWLIAILVVSGLMLFKIRTLLPGANSAEIATMTTKVDPKSLLYNPFFGFYKLAQYGLSLIHKNSLIDIRLIGIACGYLAVWFMYYTLKKWHNTKVALFGTLLFCSSSWFLNYSRLAEPNIMYTILIGAFAYGTWVRHSKISGLILFIGSLLAVAFIYTPGLVWFVILAAIWQKNTIMRQVANAPKIASLSLGLLVILVSPLIFAIYKDINLLKTLLGFSQNPLHDILHLGQYLLLTFDQLFFHGLTDPSLGIVGIPLVDAFVTTMAVIGGFAYFKLRQLDRSKMIAISLLLAVILVALKGPVSSIILMPIIYLLAGTGINHMLKEWSTIFPRNPVAKSVGLGLMIALVCLSSFYHIERYFIAWPKAPATVKVFQLH